MPKVKSKTTFAVIAAVADATWGWGKEKAKLSIPELAQAAGVSEGGTRKAFLDADFQTYVTQEPVDPNNPRLGYFYRVPKEYDTAIYVNKGHRAMPHTDIVPATEGHSTLPHSDIATPSALKEDIKEPIKENKKQKQKESPKKKYIDCITDLEIPEKFANTLFVNAFNEFISHRREMKKPLTPRAGKMTISNLEPYSLQDAVDALNVAISGGYQGVFPKHSTPNGRANGNYGRNGHPAPKPSTYVPSAYAVEITE